MVTKAEAGSADTALQHGLEVERIEEIRDGNGRVLYRRKGDGPGRVIEPGVIAGLDDLFRALGG